MRTQVMNEEIQEVEISIESARTIANRYQALDRLLDNKDFQLLIRKGYQKDEPIRLANVSADPRVDSEAVMEELKAIGYFTQYLMGVEQMGRQALLDLQAHEQTLEVLRQEELEA